MLVIKDKQIRAALCLPCLTDSPDRVETNELIRTDSSSGHTYMFCRGERKRSQLERATEVLLLFSSFNTFCNSNKHAH